MWEDQCPWSAMGCDREKGVAPSQTLGRCSLFSRYPSRFTNVKMQLHILLLIVSRKQILSCVAFVSRLTAESVCVQKGVQASPLVSAGIASRTS